MTEKAATTKTLTIAQPWATLVAIGAKQIETRSWQTNYRGDIAIHAGKGLVASGGRSGLIELCNTMHFRQALYKGGFITHNHCDFDALLPGLYLWRQQSHQKCPDRLLKSTFGAL